MFHDMYSYTHNIQCMNRVENCPVAPHQREMLYRFTPFVPTHAHAYLLSSSDKGGMFHWTMHSPAHRQLYSMKVLYTHVYNIELYKLCTHVHVHTQTTKFS